MLGLKVLIKERKNQNKDKFLQEGKTAQTELVEDRSQMIAAKLEKEIKDGQIEVNVDSNKIVIRIAENGTFTSGMAEMKRSFKPILEKLNQAIVEVGGNVTVAGHTDNVPISSSLYRSNWDLSSSSCERSP